MLRQGLKICEDMGFNKVLLCCNKSNPGSVKTIIENGSVLDSETIFKGERSKILDFFSLKWMNQL
jgi:predicted acetyltransferase